MLPFAFSAAVAAGRQRHSGGARTEAVVGRSPRKCSLPKWRGSQGGTSAPHCCNPPDFPTKTYIEKNAAVYGEPALPSGYDTCPETYPASAFANAEQIKARARDLARSDPFIHSSSRSQSPQITTSSLFASGSDASGNKRKQPSSSSSSSFGVGFGALFGLAALVVSAIGVAGAVAQRKARSASQMGASSEDEMIGSYHPASVYELATGGKTSED
mmetsp:Transcript_11627/g.38815  ORF Transcript_11627/g.38815 Transcript_11627/m.38815 type:complete len:215 (+) Transcript_11627:747-1391(+)